MTTSPMTPGPTDTAATTDVDVEARVARLRATCAQLEDDLVGIAVAAPTRRSARLLQALQARLHAVQRPATPAPTTPTWIPAPPSPPETPPELAATTPVTIAPSSSPSTSSPERLPATVTASSAPSSSVPDVVLAAPPAAPSFTVLVGDAPPAGLATTAAPQATTTRSKAQKAQNAQNAPSPTGPAAPSLRAGALLQGVLTALSAAATATPLTLGLALTTTVTALIAGASRGLWSRLGQLAGLGTIASVVVALWPLGERLSYGRPVGEEELLVALPQVLLALQSLRLVWKAGGRSTPKTRPSSTSPATTTAATTAVRPGLMGLAFAIGVAVAVDLSLLLLAVGPVWSWLWRSSRGWLALALLVMAGIDRAVGRHRTTGVIVVGLGIAVAVVLGVGAWNLRHAVFHDVFSLARAGVAVVVGVLALALTVRVIRRRQPPEPGVAR